MNANWRGEVWLFAAMVACWPAASGPGRRVFGLNRPGETPCAGRGTSSGGWPGTRSAPPRRRPSTGNDGGLEPIGSGGVQPVPARAGRTCVHAEIGDQHQGREGREDPGRDSAAMAREPNAGGDPLGACAQRPGERPGRSRNPAVELASGQGGAAEGLSLSSVVFRFATPSRSAGCQPIRRRVWSRSAG